MLRRESRRPSTLPFVSRLPVVKQIQVFGVLAALLLLAAVGLLALNVSSWSRIAASHATATEMQMLSQRIARTAALAAQGSEPDFNRLKEASGRFRSDLDALAGGGTVRGTRISPLADVEAQRALGSTREHWQRVEGNVTRLLERQGAVVAAGGDAARGDATQIAAARQAAAAIGNDADTLLRDTTELAAAIERQGERDDAVIWAAVGTGVLAMLVLGLLGKLFLDDARARAYQSEQENLKNQEAILRLLNEMGNLADGDLTVQATVSEDITGAIADSINYTIEELRTLVRGINAATDEVGKATADAQSISNRLYEASQRQNRGIQQVSASVLAMAQSINEVSASAGQSARVAQQSLSAAEKGGDAVQNQIAGMNEIRTQIQDTAKRIKRLGDSSLEIGEIVELISGLTEQTNVLALNAAIQAASAGEAGRGFSIVAEEVQRLAERSAEATKQIEAIVKMTQADTQDAVAAMERSTEGVVEGAKLSDAAGQALEEIRNVSRELAGLIDAISQQTQKQSASVTDVTRVMQGILEITEETTEGTKQSNVSIGQLTRLAATLRSSVAGFKV